MELELRVGRALLLMLAVILIKKHNFQTIDSELPALNSQPPTVYKSFCLFCATKYFFLEHLLFAAYLVLFSWLITKVAFYKKSGLTPAQLVIIFLLKVIAGIFYGWIGVYYGNLAQMVDTWMFHYEGMEGYELLLSSPKEFFTSLFKNNYQEYGRFLSSENSWWNDLHNNFFIMIISFF